MYPAEIDNVIWTLEPLCIEQNFLKVIEEWLEGSWGENLQVFINQ